MKYFPREQFYIRTFKVLQSLDNKNLSVQDSLQAKGSSTAARPPASLMAAEEAECRNNLISRSSRGSRTHWNARSVWKSGDLQEHSWRCGRRCGKSRYYSCYSWTSAGLKVSYRLQLSWKEKKKGGRYGFIIAIIKTHRWNKNLKCPSRHWCIKIKGLQLCKTFFF